MEKVNLKEKFGLFNDYWNPKIVGELNNQHVKLVKFKGEFVWHKHNEEDELFFVIDGSFIMEFRDKSIEIKTNEFNDFGEYANGYHIKRHLNTSNSIYLNQLDFKLTDFTYKTYLRDWLSS